MRERDLAQSDLVTFKKMSEENDRAKDQAINSLRHSIKQQKEEIEMLKATAVEVQATEKRELEATLEQLRTQLREKSRVEAEANEAKLQMQAIMRERDLAQSDVVVLKKMSEEKDQA